MCGCVQFLRFLARFGPLEFTIAKAVSCFCVNRELVPWFHGMLGRNKAEQVLSNHSSSYGDGAFLVRFSETHPTKFTLTYVKVHVDSGRREMKNCLLENIGTKGYALSDSRNRAYPSIQSFVQRSAARLRTPVGSFLAERCNQALARIRAQQDHHCNSYTSFSAETLDMHESAPKELLFSSSPPASIASLVQRYKPDNQADNDSASCADNYTSFALNTVTPPRLTKPIVRAPLARPPNPTTNSPANSLRGAYTQDDYGCFTDPVPAAEISISGFKPGDSSGSSSTSMSSDSFSTVASSDYSDFVSFVQQSNNQVPSPVALRLKANDFNAPSDAYATFDSLAARFTAESEKLAQRGEFAMAFAQRSPPRNLKCCDNNQTYGFFGRDEVANSPPRHARSMPPRTMESATLQPESLRDSAPDLYGRFEPPSKEPQSLATASFSAASPNSDVYGSFAALQLTEPTPIEGSVMLSGQIPLPPPAALVPVDQSSSGESIVSALSELNTGMEYYKQKLLDQALHRFISARGIAKATEDRVVEARALGNLGTVYLDMENPQQAVVCYQQCLDITKQIKDTKRERTILNNLVLALMACEEFDRALCYCQVQLDMTINEINRRKILSRMSLLREKVARSSALD